MLGDYMPVSVTCNSCGHNLLLPEEFQRRKVRCPECGVYCEVAMPAKQRSAPKKAADRTNPSPPPPAGEPPIVRAPTSDESPPAPRLPDPPAEWSGTQKAIIHCTFCGELVRAKAKKCPNCGTKVIRPPKLPKPAAAVPQPRKILKPASTVQTSDDSEDSLPYSFDAGPQEVLCAKCQGKLPADAVLCVHCGSNLDSGQKVERVYEKIERRWESNMSLSRRKTIYIATQAIVFPLMLGTDLL